MPAPGGARDAALRGSSLGSQPRKLHTGSVCRRARLHPKTHVHRTHVWGLFRSLLDRIRVDCRALRHIARPAIRFGLSPRALGIFLMKSIAARTRKRKKSTPATASSAAAASSLAKAPSGIDGLDEITGGGLPARPPDAGLRRRRLRQDALRACEFLVNGALQHRRAGRLHGLRGDRRGARQNVASLGFDLEALRRQEAARRSTSSRSSAARSRRAASTTSRVSSSASGHAIDSIGAKRVVLDTLEALFAGFTNEAILRAELRRLFRWLKDKGVTAVITGERGEGTLTRHGLEEYVSDCVILLDHRVDEPGLDAPAAHRQVPRLGARHQRVSLPDRRERHLGAADHAASGSTTPASSERISTGVAPARRHARRRRLLPRHERARLGHGRHRQEQPRRACSSTPPAGAARRRSTSRSRSRTSRSSATCAPSASNLEPLGQEGAACASRPRAPRCTAWRCTSSPCTRRSRSSSRRPSSSIPSPAW